MAQLTFSEAATQVGVTRQTIYKYVSQGRLSATIAHNGQKQIEVTELLRVFGRLQSPGDKPTGTINNKRMSTQTQATDVLQLELERSRLLLQAKELELSLMRERVEELKAREQEAKAQVKEATEQHSRLLGIIEQQGRLLAPPKPAARSLIRTKKVAAPESDEGRPISFTTDLPKKAATLKRKASKPAKKAEKKSR